MPVQIPEELTRLEILKKQFSSDFELISSFQSQFFALKLFAKEIIVKYLLVWMFFYRLFFEWFMELWTFELAWTHSPQQQNPFENKLTFLINQSNNFVPFTEVEFFVEDVLITAL